MAFHTHASCWQASRPSSGTLRRGSRWSSSPQPAAVLRRTFRTSAPRRDILFVSVPAFKAFLLSATRVTLVVLPFWWRYVKHAPSIASKGASLCSGLSCHAETPHLLQMEAL